MGYKVLLNIKRFIIYKHIECLVELLYTNIYTLNIKIILFSICIYVYIKNMYLYFVYIHIYIYI